VKPGTDNEVVVTATLKSDNVEVDQQQNGNPDEIASHLLGLGIAKWPSDSNC